MAAAAAPGSSALTHNYDKAREDYARAQEQMLATAAELDRLQKELQKSQQAVLEVLRWRLQHHSLSPATLPQPALITSHTAALLYSKVLFRKYKNC